MEVRLDTHENRMQVLWWMKLGLPVEVTTIEDPDYWCAGPLEKHTLDGWIDYLQSGEVSEADNRRKFRLLDGSQA